MPLELRVNKIYDNSLQKKTYEVSYFTETFNTTHFHKIIPNDETIDEHDSINPEHKVKNVFTVNSLSGNYIKSPY